MCLIGSHDLAFSIYTLPVVVVLSGLSYCQIFSSAYSSHLVLVPIFTFQCFRVYIFMRWPILVGHLISYLDASILSWLFPNLAALFYIDIWLLYVWPCVRSHYLTVTHFHIIHFNCYLAVISPDLCLKSSSDCLFSMITTFAYIPACFIISCLFYVYLTFNIPIYLYTYMTALTVLSTLCLHCCGQDDILVVFVNLLNLVVNDQARA